MEQSVKICDRAGFSKLLHGVKAIHINDVDNICTEQGMFTICFIYASFDIIFKFIYAKFTPS